MATTGRLQSLASAWLGGSLSQVRCRDWVCPRLRAQPDYQPTVQPRCMGPALMPEPKLQPLILTHGELKHSGRMGVAEGMSGLCSLVRRTCRSEKEWVGKGKMTFGDSHVQAESHAWPWSYHGG